MNRKICPYCKGNAYSAYDGPDWICPYCGRQMENVPNEPVLDPSSDEDWKCGSMKSSKVVDFKKHIQRSTSWKRSHYKSKF